MKKTTHFGYVPPSKYADIVTVAYTHHKRRLDELRDAEKLIRAIEPELAELGRRGHCYAVDEGSMIRRDCRKDQLVGRAVWALQIGSGVFRSSGDRLIDDFVEFGWQIERIDLDGEYFSRAILRKPKTQIRVVITGTHEKLAARVKQEAAA